MKDDAYISSSSPGSGTGVKCTVSDCILFTNCATNISGYLHVVVVLVMVVPE